MVDLKEMDKFLWSLMRNELKEFDHKILFASFSPHVNFSLIQHIFDEQCFYIVKNYLVFLKLLFFRNGISVFENVLKAKTSTMRTKIQFAYGCTIRWMCFSLAPVLASKLNKLKR